LNVGPRIVSGADRRGVVNLALTVYVVQAVRCFAVLRV
jgi:hypothetical protein